MGLMIENSGEEKQPILESEGTIQRSNLSLFGESQVTPEELIARGEGTGNPSVCQKL